MTIPKRREQLRRKAEAAYERGDRRGALHFLEQAVALKRIPRQTSSADGSRVADALFWMKDCPEESVRGAARYALALDHVRRMSATPKNKRPKDPTRSHETRINALAQSIRRARLKMLQK
ncbi:MAG: hypothetical protein HOP13_05735 [Alphaproteobacteria bacterium]|nr:hypothetical protein [Alphaproteobacteria bacterium]